MSLPLIHITSSFFSPANGVEVHACLLLLEEAILKDTCTGGEKRWVLGMVIVGYLGGEEKMW
jgi:hypothetical protein